MNRDIKWLSFIVIGVCIGSLFNVQMGYLQPTKWQVTGWIVATAVSQLVLQLHVWLSSKR